MQLIFCALNMFSASLLHTFSGTTKEFCVRILNAYADKITLSANRQFFLFPSSVTMGACRHAQILPICLIQALISTNFHLNSSFC